MKVLHVASEAYPFYKTGGLGDVIYSLSKEMVKNRLDVSIALPFYKTSKTNKDDYLYIDTLSIQIGEQYHNAYIFKKEVEGIEYYFIENDYFFYRDSFYGYEDDDKRFAFFSKAVCSLFVYLNKKIDIIHVHDYHVGMIPCLIKEDRSYQDFYKNSKTLLTIHNPAFQGLIDPTCIYSLYNLPYELYENGSVRFKGKLSTLKSAIMYVDKVTTVSPTHRYELLTDDGSMGLAPVLRYREYDFKGILNGIDFSFFNPKNDRMIQENFDLRNFVSKKELNRKEILKRFNLVDKNKPLFVLVSRLSWQKGVDVLFPAVETLLNKGCNVVLLGSGEQKYENMMEDLRNRYPSLLGIYRGYNEELAHQLYAASTFFLMPSVYEPCGLGQLIAQRYGSLPIVRYTGGLKDSVIGYDSSNLEVANGFGFYDYTVSAMVNTCLWAYQTSKDSQVLRKLQKNAMKVDNSWTKAAKEYLAIYKELF